MFSFPFSILIFSHHFLGYGYELFVVVSADDNLIEEEMRSFYVLFAGSASHLINK